LGKKPWPRAYTGQSTDYKPSLRLLFPYPFPLCALFFLCAFAFSSLPPLPSLRLPIPSLRLILPLRLCVLFSFAFAFSSLTHSPFAPYSSSAPLRSLLFRLCLLFPLLHLPLCALFFLCAFAFSSLYSISLFAPSLPSAPLRSLLFRLCLLFPLLHLPLCAFSSLCAFALSSLPPLLFLHGRKFFFFSFSGR